MAVEVTSEMIDALRNMAGLLSRLREKQWEEMWSPFEDVEGEQQKRAFRALRSKLREARQMDLQIEAIHVAVYLHGKGVDLSLHIENLRDGKHRPKGESI